MGSGCGLGGMWLRGILDDMKKFRESDHAAELRIQVSGDTVEHLFVNAAEALADILSPNRYASVASTERISVESMDKDAALVDFLNELLTHSHTERSVYLPESVTLASAQGRTTVKAVMHRYSIPTFEEDIKAVTHQDVHIAQKEDMWQTDLVFDI